MACLHRCDTLLLQDYTNSKRYLFSSVSLFFSVIKSLLLSSLLFSINRLDNIMFGFVLRNCRFIFLCLFLLIHERNNLFSIFIIFSSFFSLYGSIRVRIVFILICYFSL